MGIEKSLQPPSPDELKDLLKHYSIDEEEILLEQLKSDIKVHEEKIYSTIKEILLRRGVKKLSNERRQFFLEHLKEEDLELAAQLNKQ